MKRLAFRAATCFFIVLWAALLPVGSQEKRRRLPYRFLIPEGYVGWVRVDFSVAGAPPLPIEDGYYILKIPPEGLLKTSSRRMEVRGEQYYYFSGDTKYQLEISSLSKICIIHQRFTGPGPLSFPPEYPYIYIFVGPTTEYEKCKFNEPCNPLDEDGRLKPGPRAMLTEEEARRFAIGRP